VPISDPPFIPKDIIANPDTGKQLAPVTITGTVTDPAVLPNINSMTDPPKGMYVGYGAAVAYDFDMGLRGQPVADGPNASLAQFTRVHSGMCHKGIAAVAVMLGADPELPSPDTGSTNDVLLAKGIRSISPGKLPDGTPFNVTLVGYLYGLQRMPSPTDMLDRGSTPIDVNGPSSNLLNPALVFDSDLMGPAAPVTNGPSGGIAYLTR
jgi:hypothetical protein